VKAGPRGNERGASTLEYVGLLFVLAAVVGALVAVGLPTQVESGAKTAVCKVFGTGDCGKRFPQGVSAANHCAAFCPTKDNPIHPSDPVVAATKGGYVAMGDSYSSGEGANSSGGFYVTSPNGKYLDNSGKTGCHRAAAAYSQGLQKEFTFTDGGSFVACSGATSDDIVNGFHGEPSQLDALNPRTTLVTLSAGGDDLNFSSVMQNCVLDPHSSQILLPGKHTDRCTSQKATIDQNMHALFDSPPNPPKYEQFLQKIHDRAPNARVMIVGYPHLFPEPPTKAYDTISKGDQEFLNNMDKELNRRIQQATQNVDTRNYGNGRQKMGSIEYADNWDGLKGHEITSKHPWINGLEYCPVINWRHNQNCHSGLFGAPGAGTGTFHPTHEGQQSFERSVAKQLRTGPNRTLYDP
jgi:GDSL-like Lipase/Acylhydrolase family